MYKLEDLLLVNKDPNISNIVTMIKEKLESEEIKKIVNSVLFTKDTTVIVKTQGSYNRHTASFLNKSKSDIDIILYIGEYNTNNATQFTKDCSLSLYKKHMSNKIKNSLQNVKYEKPDESFRELKYFVELKKQIFVFLKHELGNKFIITNKNKCINLSSNNIDIDIVIAGKWNLESYKNFEGSNIITNNPPYEIQNLPELNKNNIESKKEKAQYLYEYIRIFKNINKLIKNDRLSSYSIECILYNLDNTLFQKYPNKDSLISICNHIDSDVIDIFDKREIYENNEVFILNYKIAKIDLIYALKDIRNFIEKEL